jgi:16S rRNA processing protein RimM
MKKPRKPKAAPTMPPPERRLVLCVVGAPHGVRGECRVKSFTADPLAIADYGALFAADGRAFEIEQGRWLKDDMLVVRFAGMTDRDVVAKLTNIELFVDRDNLPETEEEDEFYHADLIGLEAVDEAGTLIGRVDSMQNFGAGDIVEIRPVGGGQTWLLPFTKEAALKVDIKGGKLLIDPAHLAKPEPHQERPGYERPPAKSGKNKPGSGNKKPVAGSKPTSEGNP